MQCQKMALKADSDFKKLTTYFFIRPQNGFVACSLKAVQLEFFSPSM